MIVLWFFSVAAGFVQWLASLFPVLELPDQLVNLDDGFNSVFAMGDGLGAFVPWPVIGVLAAVPLTIWVGGLTIRALRALIAHLPFIGGRG